MNVAQMWKFQSAQTGHPGQQNSPPLQKGISKYNWPG